MLYNTKRKGNKAEAVVLSEFLRHDIPVLLPFGDNEKYDLVVDLNGEFKSVQVKYGTMSNGCVQADIRHRIGKKRVAYESYNGKVDFIAIWVEEINKIFLIQLEDFGERYYAILRIDQPKNNSCISKIRWAKDFEFSFVLKQMIS